MSLRGMGRLAAIVVPLVICIACGETYRPVVIPINNNPPTPSSFHAVFGISSNTPNFPGGAMQIDVSGDTVIGETPTSDLSKPNLGDVPTHAAMIANNTRVFVASAGSVLPGGSDVVSSFSPAIQSPVGGGLGTVTTISLPAGSQPVFLGTTQSSFMYVANFGTNSVSTISLATNAVTNTAPVGTHPVSLAELPNGNKLYVANQGSNTVSSVNTVDLSQNPVTGFTGVTPVWVVARGDSQKVYVLTQGDGQLVTIDTVTDTVTSSLPVGAGANYMFFDSHLNRIYVTNPAQGRVYVFSDTGGANDTPKQLAQLTVPGACATCGPAIPVSVTALLDGSRFYVASYQTTASCPDPVVGAGSACVVAGLTVYDAPSLSIKYSSTPTMTLLTWPPFTTNQYAVPPVASCAPPVAYAPGTTRFRVFTTAAADSSHVYVSMCDAGAIAVVDTGNSNANNPGGGQPADTLVIDLLAAYSAGPPQGNGQPAPQNPIFLLMGQ